MKHILTLTVIATMALCHFGCSSDEEPTDADSPIMEGTLEVTPDPEVIEMPDVVPLTDDVVLESMSKAEAEQLEDKTPVQIVTVLEGTQRVTIEARFRGIRDFGFGFPLYECELMAEDVEKMGGIASGMSGSPVGPPGKIMGALAYGDYFSAAPTRFWVTAIDAMEATREHQTFGDELAEHLAAAPSARINTVYAPVKTPLMITGIKPNRLQHIESYLKGSRFDYIELFADVG